MHKIQRGTKGIQEHTGFPVQWLGLVLSLSRVTVRSLVWKVRSLKSWVEAKKQINQKKTTT